MEISATVYCKVICCSRASGDPYLVIEEFRRILEELRRRGIRDITGDLLIDDSWFSIAEEDPGAFDNDPYRTYNVLPSAFLVNFKAVRFHFYPAANGRHVRVHPEPELAGLEIDNRLRLRKRRCGGFQRGIAVGRPGWEKPTGSFFSGRFSDRLQPLYPVPFVADPWDLRLRGFQVHLAATGRDHRRAGPGRYGAGGGQAVPGASFQTPVGHHQAHQQVQ